MLTAITEASVYAEKNVDYSNQLSELKALIEQCEDRGIPTDYEQVSYATIERFAEYINDDMEKGIDSSYTDYEKASVDSIYNKAKTNLESYLDGTKEANRLVRPNMQAIEVKGSNIYYGKKPIFSIGYGFFGMAQADIPNFQSFGVNNIQMEIGPDQTWEQASDGWNIYAAKEGQKVSGDIVSGIAHSGDNSLNMMFGDTAGANVYIAAERTIPCKPNTKYTFGGWVKGTATEWNAWMKLGWDDSDRADIFTSSDWKEYKDTYTTGADQTSLSLLILVENTANLYFDDLYVYEDASNKNLLSNGGFEELVYPAIEDLKVHLENAEENNVAVSLLLSPHYLDSSVSGDVPMTSNKNATFIKFDINNQKAKEIVEHHIRAVLSNVSGYECIDSICLSNEPWFDTRWFENTYNPLFRDYLVEKHGSLEGIKTAHNASYARLNSITMPKIDENSIFGWNAVDALTYDWMEFNDKVFSDWHKWMAGIAKEYFPDTPLHSKVMENVVPIETNERLEMTRGTDYDMFGEFSGYAGIDGANYTEDDYYKMMFLYDYLDSSVAKPVYDSETHIIKDYTGSASSLDAFSQDTTKKALTKMWQGAIHGRDISTVWAWQRQYADDGESDFFGSVLFRPDLIYGIGKMNLDFARLADEIVELQENSDKVAIFYSKPSRLYNESHITSVLSVYKELVKNGYSVGIVTEKSIDKLSGYDTLILPKVTHSKKDVLSAVEAFVSKGGKVLYTDTDVLSYNEYEQKMSNSAIINGGMTYTLSNLPSAKVVVKNADGNAANGIEWKYSVTEDRILVNVVNMTESDKSVAIYYNGEKLTAMNELISGEKGIGAVNLKSYEPQLLEYKLESLKKPDVMDLYFDDVRKAICWKTVGESVAGVNIYQYNADNTLSFVCKTSGDEFFYEKVGTYLVCPVLEDGTEASGRVITTADNIADVTISGAEGNSAGAIVNNCTEHYIRVKVLVEMLDSEQNVVSRGHSKTFIAPKSSHNIDVFLSSEGEAESVRITVFDDMDNCLQEKLEEIR